MNMDDDVKKGEVEKDDRPSPKVELSDQDLEKVSGGIHIVKLVDKASPKLYEACSPVHEK